MGSYRNKLKTFRRNAKSGNNGNFTSSTINSVRKNIRKETEILVTPEEVVSAFRKMLNENALKILNDMSFSYLERKPRKIRAKKEEQTEILNQGTNNVLSDSNSGTANS